MAVKYLSGNRVTVLSTDLVGTTVDVAESETPATFTGNANNASRVEASQMQTTVSTGDVISAISANYYQSEGGSTNTVFGIYTNNSGSPQTLLAQTVEGQPTGTGWKTFDLQTPYTVPASVNGQNLWVGVYADGDSNLYSKQSGAGGTKSYNVGSYSSTMPSTFTVSNTYTNVSNMKLVNTPPKLGSTSPTPTPTSSGGTLSPTSSGSTVLATTSLGFTASNTWVLRFSTIFSSYGDNTYWLAYVANSDAGDQTNQNGIGSNWKKSSGVNTFGVHSSQNAQPYLSNPSDSQTISPDSSSKYYWEIIRLGDTSAKVNYYGTDSTYGTISSTSANTSISNATGLDRIKFFSGSSTNGSRTIAIADVKFYNGITSASATDNAVNVQTNTIAEETDTGKHRMWNSTTNTWTEII